MRTNHFFSLILKHGLTMVVAVFLTIPVWACLENAYAGETSVLNRILILTSIKTDDTPLFLSTVPIDAFTPTTVICPKPKTCTLRVEVSSQFNGIDPPDPNVAAVSILIDGSATGVLPNHVLGFDSTSTGGGSNVRTFSWMKTGLEIGHHTVEVKFYVTAGFAASANRTLTIGVYKP